MFGPLIIDIQGKELLEQEAQTIQHPGVGGVILFARNYQDPNQCSQLTKDIRSLKPELLIFVDQEGGRVQRFDKGFTKLPSLGAIGQWYTELGAKSEEALGFVEQMGYLMAKEVLAVGCDLSLAPVLDIQYDLSPVIRDRAFHCDPNMVTLLGSAYIRGMHAAGMAATGKHFPGHGYVAADSHLTLPIDERSFEQIEAEMQPFKDLLMDLSAIMPAHVIYKQCDPLPACFSPFWCQSILREKMGFEGIIVSDDLSMAGAASMGSYPERVEKALNAGCDLLLLCNTPNAVKEVLMHSEKILLEKKEESQFQNRCIKLASQKTSDWRDLQISENWRQAQKQCQEFCLVSGEDEYVMD